MTSSDDIIYVYRHRAITAILLSSSRTHVCMWWFPLQLGIVLVSNIFLCFCYMRYFFKAFYFILGFNQPGKVSWSWDLLQSLKFWIQYDNNMSTPLHFPQLPYTYSSLNPNYIFLIWEMLSVCLSVLITSKLCVT